MRTFVETIAEEYGNRSEPPEIFCSLKTKPSVDELLGSVSSNVSLTGGSVTPSNRGLQVADDQDYPDTPGKGSGSGLTTPNVYSYAEEGGRDSEEFVLSPVSDEGAEYSENSREDRILRKKEKLVKAQKSESTVEVRFVWSGPVKEAVYLVGDFAGWVERVPLEPQGDVFLATLDLEPGLYRFKYIVDGEWKHDERRRTHIDEHGNVNNEVRVGLKPVKFVWRTGAREVGVTGSFCGWKHVINLVPGTGEERKVSIMVPPGVYEYKFIVDGQWHLDSDAPSRKNATGHWNSVLRV
eukprot:CAMPEP_0184740580 /NCGR_PEP_ID=MMETSP0315-20130426/3562_1 /TAXON_ID=101924 /ORGANISM="Rhodosorus marinus, Strain UTEX LB 2760" /LENGTH=294 /DNA_ID=CAMNT_0027210301 /DNA_START=237 /DNA_END=1121 /DNA_ORIENTATION=+